MVGRVRCGARKLLLLGGVRGAVLLVLWWGERVRVGVRLDNGGWVDVGQCRVGVCSLLLLLLLTMVRRWWRLLLLLRVSLVAR